MRTAEGLHSQERAARSRARAALSSCLPGLTARPSHPAWISTPGST